MPLLRENYDPAIKAGAVDTTGADLQDVLDTSDNELLEWDEVASAVNYIRLANAATGNNPALTATGDDTNIALQLSSTGSALVLVGNSGSVTIAQGSATVNAQRGVITTGAAITAASTSAVYSFDFKNNRLTVDSVLFMQIVDQSGNGQLTIGNIDRGSGSATVRLINLDQDTAVTGSAKIAFVVIT